MVVEGANGRKPGFRVRPRLVHLDFEGTDLEGAEVDCRQDIEMEVFVECQRLLSSMTPEDMSNLTVLAGLFGEHIVADWNLEDEGGSPYPVSGEGMQQLPGRVALMLIAAWTRQMQMVSAPLAEPSDDGGTSAEVMMSLADASRNLENSSEPV